MAKYLWEPDPELEMTQGQACWADDGRAYLYVAIGFGVDGGWGYGVAVDDGIPSRDDGLPTTLHQVEGEAADEADAKAKAVGEYERWTAEYNAEQDRIEAQMEEAAAAADAEEAAGLYDQPAEDDVRLDEWVETHLGIEMSEPQRETLRTVAEKVSPIACCEQAQFIPCVCAYAFRCPVHGDRHHGTHE